MDLKDDWVEARSAAAWEEEYRVFNGEKNRQKRLVEEWEHRMQLAVYTAHSILVGSVVLSTALTLMSPAEIPSLVAHQSIPTIICSVLLFLYGVAILYICLAHFVALPSSRAYVCIFFHGLLFDLAMPYISFLPGKFVGKSKTPNWVEYLLKRSCVLRAIANARQYLQEYVGVAGSGFLIKAICFEPRNIAAIASIVS